MRPTDVRGTSSRARAPPLELVRRQLGPPLAEWLESVPKLGLGRSLVERRVDIGHDQRLHGRREPLQLARLVLQRIREGKLDRVQELDRALSHRHDELRLDDVELARQERARLLFVSFRELDAVRAVYRHRIDVETLQRLQNRLAG